MPSPFFSGRIPQELSDRINQHCTETGESKTQVLLNALSKYLDFPIKPSVATGVSIEMFNQLEQRVTELEKKLEITSVSSVDNTILAENEIADNNTDLVEQPDNNLIQEDETSDNSIEIIKHPDNIDNTINRVVEPVNEDQTQLSILDSEQQTEADQSDQKPWIIKTNEVNNLPGIGKINDKNKLPQKLRNAKAGGKTEIEIGQYLLRFYKKQGKINGSMLWEVITTNNN